MSKNRLFKKSLISVLIGMSYAILVICLILLDVYHKIVPRKLGNIWDALPVVFIILVSSYFLSSSKSILSLVKSLVLCSIWIIAAFFVSMFVIYMFLL